jgi:hypothetical protein
MKGLVLNAKRLRVRQAAKVLDVFNVEESMFEYWRAPAAKI